MLVCRTADVKERLIDPGVTVSAVVPGNVSRPARMMGSW
jgi:hypothetical protein